MAENVSKEIGDALLHINKALGGEDYSYYDYDLTKLVTDPDSKKTIKAALRVIVPQAKRSVAAKRISDNLISQGYQVDDTSQSGLQLDVILPAKGKGKASKIRLNIKPVKGGRGTAATAINESGQALWAEYLFNHHKGKIDKEDIPEITEEMLKKAYDKKRVDVDLEDILGLTKDWKDSSILGANKLWSMYGHKEGKYHFYRGSGLDDKEIKKAFATVKKGNGTPGTATPFTSEDKWNPADIWMAKASFDPATITKNARTKLVGNLNAFLIKQYNKGDPNLLGISLKKMTSTAKAKLVNYNASRSHLKIKYDGYDAAWGQNSVSKDVTLKCGDSTKLVFRTFGGDTKANFNGELQGAKAAQGKISYPIVASIIKGLNKEAKFPPNKEVWAKSAAKNKKGREELAEGIRTMLKKNKTGGIIPTVADVIAQERGLIYSKYMGLLVIDGINGIKKKEERDECVMDLYMYASSQHLDSGLHLKLQ